MRRWKLENALLRAIFHFPISIFQFRYPHPNINCAILAAQSPIVHTISMKIKVYSTPTCPYCKLVKEYLDGQKIAYTEVNVADDSTAANEMVKLSGQMGVPVVDIDGDVIVGWNKDALEEALGKAGGAAPAAPAAVPKAEEKAAA